MKTRINSFLIKGFLVSFLTGACLSGVAHAVTPLSGGDRIFVLGDQWIANGTVDQLTGFDVIRLSSYKPQNDMKAIKDTYGKKLGIGLVPGETAPHDGAHGQPIAWPDDVLRDYENTTGPLKAYEDSLIIWVNNSVDIALVDFGLEYEYSNYPVDSTNIYTKQVVAAKWAEVMRKYKQITTEQSPGTQFWAYSSWGSEDDYYSHGCDWFKLTETQTDTFAIDGCWINQLFNIQPSWGPMNDRKGIITQELKAVDDSSNSKPVTFQIIPYGISHPEIRNFYHVYWDDFRELIIHAKNTVDTLNAMNTPFFYFKGHYETPYGDYSQDGDVMIQAEMDFC